MNRRNLLNLGLLAFIGLLVLLVAYEPGIEKPTELPNLLQLNKDDVKQIAIHRDGQQDIKLQRQADDKWQVTSPLQYPANQYRVDSLLRVTTTRSLGSFAAEPQKLAAYNLAEPQVSLTLNGDTTITFGGSTPLDHRRYVLVNDRVHLIGDTLYYQLIGNTPTFLRKQLFDAGIRIEAITLPELSVKWQNERWQLSPEPETFSADQVTQLLDNWRLASALEIRAYDKTPGEKITIKVSGQEPQLELLLTSREPDLILARPDLGIQYHFDASNSEKLLQLSPMTPPEEEAQVEETEPADGHNH